VTIDGVNGDRLPDGARFRLDNGSLRIHARLTWVQVWVQLGQGKWLPISCKRHQIGHLDFRSFRLLTEMLEVRILPGEPKFFAFKQLRSLGRAFGFGPNAGACEANPRTEVVEGQVLRGNVSRVNKRCHRNVIARLDFAAGGPLLVAAL